MTEKVSPSVIAPRAREAARQLRDIAAFLDSIDAIEGGDIPGWDYLGTRFFREERNSLLDVADVLEYELAPEAENYA